MAQMVIYKQKYNGLTYSYEQESMLTRGSKTNISTTFNPIHSVVT